MENFRHLMQNLEWQRQLPNGSDLFGNIKGAVSLEETMDSTTDFNTRFEELPQEFHLLNETKLAGLETCQGNKESNW